MGIENQTLLLDDGMGEVARGEVTWPGGATVQIRYLTEGQVQKIAEKCRSARGGGISIEQYNAKLGEAIITGWDGVTVGQLCDWKLPLVKAPETDENGYVPFNPRLAAQVFTASSAFRVRISEAHDDLGDEYVKLRKNALGLS